MALRAVPDGDEHDKDIALSIRYAVDNGAKVINMSFGKSFSPEKQWVDEAAKYAASKGVLLVHAAGNDGENIDSAENYPSKVFLDRQAAPNWITVGASGSKADDLVAYFSNFGKKNVDVFAPGLNIYSTVPVGNQYRKTSGTSMASPVVAGLAAFVLSYYPTLTPEQVREVIMQSTAKVSTPVKNPQTGEMVPLSDMSISGGVVNAYEAVKLANAISGRRVAPAKSQSVVKKVKSA
jgi:subtilisin family serine protease